MPPISVVHVQKFAGISGSEGHLQQLLTRLNRTRFAPTLLMLGRGDAPREQDYAGELEVSGVRVVRAPIRADLDVGLVIRLWRWFRRERPAIVHTHLVHADLHAGIAARLARVPVLISTKHNDDRFRRRRPIAWIERTLARSTQHTITISDALRAFHLGLSRASPDTVTTIHYGYLPVASAASRSPDIRQQLGIPPGAPIVLSVGRLVEQKGHDVLLRAWQLMRHGVPGPWLVIAGEGARRDALIQLIHELMIHDRVRLVGQRADIQALMRASTVLAHPARWEGFGLVLLEAMAAGLPIVATAVSAIPEVVDDGITGSLVPPEDPIALAQAVDRILEDAKLRRTFAEAGRRQLTERFSPDTMAREHERIYEATLRAARKW